MKRNNKKTKGVTKKRTVTIISVVLFAVIVVLLSSRCIPDMAEKSLTVKSNVGKKAIALTFDDGPGDYTNELLDGLSKCNAKATFFVLGIHAEEYPAVVNRIVGDGHLLGNHSYSHINMLSMNYEKIKADIEKGSEVIESVTGFSPVFFRAPHGYTTALELKMLNQYFIKWSFDTYDWKHKDEDYVYEEIINNAKDGSIILCHDTNETTVKGVIRAVRKLTADGYEFVRVDELLSRNGEKIHAGIPYIKCKDGRKAVAY